MYSLLKKEFNAFFGSITGYLVITIFLIATSLFLWIIPGNYNLIDGQRSTLKPFFELAPWLYLFLIPAITMRMFSEEKRMGTIELLITRPISALNIVLAKYLAAMVLLVLSVVPTLIYFYSVYKLGNPVGNIDTGATWGAFIGLLFLASIYISIGLFASSISSNQVIAFLSAILLSYFFYLGFEYLSIIPLPYWIQNSFQIAGINYHYISIRRGVIDSRDLGYYVMVTIIFLAITRTIILKRTSLPRITFRNTIPFLVLLFLTVIIVHNRLFRIDLTAEKRYSITDISKQVIKKQKNRVEIELYLAGDLPAGMKEFRDAIIEKIEDFNAYSAYGINYRIIDIYKIQPESEREKIITEIIESGIEPINFEHKTTEGLSTKQIFPGMILMDGESGIALNLLKNNPLLNADDNLKNSIELLEFEIASAFRLLQQKNRLVVAFLQGNGEADNYETGDLRYQLSDNYNIVNIKASELLFGELPRVLIVADPSQRMEEKDKLHIDQYIMKGGRVLWCVDPVFASIDSLSKGMTTLAFDRDLNLRDQLFNYGVRINADLLQDAVCLEYPVSNSRPGQTANFVSAPFYYAPLAVPSPQNPLSRNLNNVLLEFSSSIEAVGDNEKLKKSIILTTSPYARSINTPVEVSLMSATNAPDQQFFNQANIPIGILLEGEFVSAFSNRMTNAFGIAENELIKDVQNNKMIVIADGGILKNKVRYRNGQVQLQPLGYDQYSGQNFGNKDFILNCVDYLADDLGLMQLRSKVIKLRMLDKVKIREQKVKWQLLNLITPVLIFIITGIIYAYYRKRKFSR